MKKILLFITAVLFINNGMAMSSSPSSKGFSNTISSIPPKIEARMLKYTWHPGCPVSLRDLAYIQLSYWGFDHKTHQGSLIVNKELAHEVVAIFHSLYKHKFPIQRMELMDDFNGNDDAAMKVNNTSSFNCRAVTGKPGEFSQHSYGRAIDINTLINPYIKGKVVLPPDGSQFTDRKKPYPGKITKESLIYKEFIKHGWDWGGSWYDLKDYQHFEKRANGERRNPYG